MGVTNYQTINGRIIGQTVDGVHTDFLTDALGNVTGTVNASGQVVNTYRHKPSGSLLAKTGAGADPRFLHVGSKGVANTTRQFAEEYMRARHYSNTTGAFTTKDPLPPSIIPFEIPYIYVRQNPTTLVDPLGLRTCPPEDKCCDSAGWGAFASNCRGSWVDCPSPADLAQKCQQYMKSSAFHCDQAKQLIGRIAKTCIDFCSGGNYGGGDQIDALTLCCVDSKGCHGCTRCCSTSPLMSPSGIDTCAAFCLGTHEATHAWDCLSTPGCKMPPPPKRECCAYHAQARCLFQMFSARCGWGSDIGYTPPLADCIKKAGALGCAGAK